MENYSIVDECELSFPSFSFKVNFLKRKTRKNDKICVSSGNKEKQKKGKHKKQEEKKNNFSSFLIAKENVSRSSSVSRFVVHSLFVLSLCQMKRNFFRLWNFVFENSFRFSLTTDNNWSEIFCIHSNVNDNQMVSTLFEITYVTNAKHTKRVDRAKPTNWKSLTTNISRDSFSRFLLFCRLENVFIWRCFVVLISQIRERKTLNAWT